MARLSKAALARAREVSKKSDEEIGRWLADMAREPMERLERELAEQGLDFLTRAYIGMPSLADMMFLDAASRFEGDAPEWLATWRALRGEYAKAGLVLRRSRGLVRVQTEARQDKGRSKGRERLAEQKKRKEAEWLRVGLAIRTKETGVPPMWDTHLAEKIAEKCARTVGGKSGSIRVSLKSLGLDRKTWLARKPVKRPRSKLRGKKLKTFGSLRR